jgi:hypothetical protein
MAYEVDFALVGDMRHVVPELLGREIEVGSLAVLRDVELVEQTFRGMPQSVWLHAPLGNRRPYREILEEAWPADHHPLNLRNASGKIVLGEVVRLTQDESYFIGEEWGLGPWGWTTLSPIKAEFADGSRFQVNGLVLRGNQHAAPIPDGLIYPREPRIHLETMKGVARAIRESRQIS